MDDFFSEISYTTENTCASVIVKLNDLNAQSVATTIPHKTKSHSQWMARSDKKSLR
jgi:hypothetical protein